MIKHKIHYTPELVKEQLEEAVKTLRFMPSGRPRGHANSWPEILRTRVEILNMEEPEEIGRRYALPHEVTAMEQALDWLMILPKIDDRKLVWLRARRVPWKVICEEFGVSRKTADKRWNKAIRSITLHLS
jgi:hypothetical protein